MFPIMFLVLSAWLRLSAAVVPVSSLGEPLPADLPPGHICPWGCISGADGSVYEITRNDITWIAKVSKAESGPRFVRAESSATIWAIVQNFYRVNGRRHRDDKLSLATFIQNYSAACSAAWATGGAKAPHPRITPRADRYRAMSWDEIPRRWRRFAVSFICGEVPNDSPGRVHVLARGFEDSAARTLFGPWYATTETQHPGGNAYYWTKETLGWERDEVRIVPATFDMTCLFVEG